MSLYSALQIANNALTAQQLGLLVTGNNVANANTPGYIREEVQFTPAPTSKLGGLLVGLGVNVNAIVQKTDRFLAERMRIASADVANSEAQESTYTEIESLLGELGDTDISSALTRFFGAIHDVLGQPESLSVRNVAIQQGMALATQIRQLDQRVRDVRVDVNRHITESAATINTLTSKIADLNVKIVNFEGGGLIPSEAAGLRDERASAANELARLIGVHTAEQPDGSLSVFAGGDYLVFGGISREVKAAYVHDRGLSTSTIRLKETDSDLHVPAGEIAGQVAARDQVLGGFLDSLDDFTKGLIQEFNRVYAGGQGLSGYDQVTSEFTASDANTALDQVSLPFTPENGSFKVQVYNKQTQQTTTTPITIRLNGLDDDTTLTDLKTALDNVPGISAQVTASGQLRISSDAANLRFGFSDDSSGVLTALGINTFFSGSSSTDINVSSVVQNDPAKFAASQNGIGADTENAVRLAAFLDQPLESRDGLSLSAIYENLVSSVSQGAASTKASADGLRIFHATLESQFLAISSVNLDEEAVRLITFQRAYQASARVIKSIDELLQTLVNL